ncbi:protein phosphatase inhibitor 2 [Episyrphus balteatus]|uniref:protein phosphatase inhibitor 2 n=1 Tax=Episyrphus balteatus TaxID=286459 RepID=UPI0024856134|nr:protein phosphatase inhibitor 2 [Episyrphus balteatus]
MQGSPDAKKPCKGILKTSSSFDRHSGSGASYRKSAKFDELNVLQTYHPPDKDYGHMKIEEPKTPYNYAEVDPENIDQLDAELLAEKLMIAANTRTSSFEDDDDDEEDSSDDNRDETEEQKDRRIAFERRRKAHYNEYEAVRLARKLIEEEDDDDDEDDSSDKQSNRNASTSSKEMDVDIQDDSQQHPSQSSQH